MARLSQGLDLSKINDESDYKPIKEGFYQVQIDKAVLKKNSKDVDMVVITAIVTEGVFSGRMIFDNLNIFHEREEVREIALRKIKTLLRVNGLPTVFEDTDQLVGLRATANIKIQQGQGDNKARNSIGYFKEPISSGSIPPSMSKPRPAQNTAPADDLDDDIPF